METRMTSDNSDSIEQQPAYTGMKNWLREIIYEYILGFNWNKYDIVEHNLFYQNYFSNSLGIFSFLGFILNYNFDFKFN